MAHYEGVEAIFEAPLPTPEKLLEYTERFLFGDLKHYAQEVDDFLGRHSGHSQINKVSESNLSAYLEKHRRPLLNQMKADYVAGKDILCLPDETCSVTVHASSFYFSIYPNGFANLDIPALGVRTSLWHIDNPQIRAFCYKIKREIVAVVQPDPSKRKILYTDDLLNTHHELLDRLEEGWLKPFSLDQHIATLRSLCPENERPLNHDFRKDLEEIGSQLYVILFLWWTISVLDANGSTRRMTDFEKYRQSDGVFDFRDLSLAEANLEDLDCRGANFSRVQLNWESVPYEQRVPLAHDEVGFQIIAALFENLDLREANFSESALGSATFYQCKLNCAVFDRADLSGVQFIDCDLSEAQFADAAGHATFENCRLSKTNFTDMDAQGASFPGSDLSEADFFEIKASLYAVLSQAEDAIPRIIEVVKNGTFNGNNYYFGPDSYGPSGMCLLGYIAQHRGVNFWEFEGIPATGCSPIERWLMAIFVDDTPETNPVSQQLLNWIDLYLLERSAGFIL